MRATDELDRYIAQERGRPFEWTSRANGDCLLFALGWAEMCGHTSPFQWRGSYGSEDEARARLNEQGGAVAAVCDVLGPPRMGSDPARFDVGLVEMDGWHRGMICTGGMWAMRDPRRGVRLLRLRPGTVDAVWQVVPR